MSTTVALESEVEGRGALYLLVLGGARFEMHALPERGELVIGRSPGCDVRIDEPSISRIHARVRVAGGVAIEDLGSVNGTRVRGARVRPDAPVRLDAGEQARLGAVTLALHRGAGEDSLPGVTPAELMARADRECARAAALGATFAIGRVVGDPAATRRALEEMLRPGDAVAERAGGHDVLLVDCAPGDPELFAQGIAALLAGGDARVGVAVYPRDGESAAALAREAAAAAAPRDAGPAIVLEDPAMRALHREAEIVARGDLAVLLLGETGAGKEVVAEAIHRSSPRAAGPFVRINCAGLAASLLESELFGHERGAFTGADRAKIGLLETAGGGTVFLDEVGELTPEVQAKLLRVLEDGEILRVGATAPRTVDVRVIAATNRDLPGDVDAGRFRSDLYFRINAATLVIPPLRNRPSEIEVLARRFAADACGRVGRRAPAFTPEAIDCLRAHDWPGNVRELRNVIERAVLFADGHILDAGAIAIESRHVNAAEPDERARILDALEQAWGNQSRAAEILGISRRTLINRLDEYDLPRPRKKKN